MTQLSNTEFKNATASLFPTNGSGQISAEDLRTQFDNTADSLPFKLTGQSAAPTANDDAANTGGNGVFEIGDFWIDETADLAYVCVDNTATAAVWVDITAAGGGGGSVSATGTPVNNQLAVWTNATTVEGDANLTWDGVDVTITGAASGIRLDDTDLTGTHEITTNAANLTFRADPTNVDASSNIAFEVDGGEVMRINGSGFVGIGRTPSTVLDIEAASTNVRLRDTDTASGGYAQFTSGSNAQFRIQADVTGAEPSSYITFEVDGTEHARIDANGDFEVNGNIVYDAEIQSASTSFTLALTDQSTIQEIDAGAGAVTITIPTNASVAFPIGSIIDFTTIDGTNTITLDADVGVTLNGVSGGQGNFTGTNYESVKLYKRATDEWVVQGAIGAVA